MNDSSINPILLSSSAHLENVEQLIKNLEKQRLDFDNSEDILSNRRRQEITKSFSAVSVNDMTIDDTPDDFLLKSISVANHGASGGQDDNLLTDSLFNQRDIFDNNDYKKQQTPPGLDHSLYGDQPSNFMWDDQYDTRANYRLTFSTNKQQQQQQQQVDSKSNRSHRHKHHRHRPQTNDSQTSSMFSDDGLPPNVTSQMTDWSMRSSTLNALDQPMDQGEVKTKIFIPQTSAQQQSLNVVRSQSHPISFSPTQPTPVNNNSPNSSSTSSSSSASWRRNKETQRTSSSTETKDARPPSPLNLYKIFQQKTQMANSSTPRSAFQYYHQQTDSVVPTVNSSMTISGEKLQWEKSRTSYYQRKTSRDDRRSSQTSSASTDQAIQTSIVINTTTSNNRLQGSTRPTPKSESYDQLASHMVSNSPHHLTVPTRPSPAPISPSTIHKSLPDLAFISQYTKDLPRSRTTSPSPAASNIVSNVSPSPSPTVTHPKPESDRPRTLKSIKRYKNSKHSTEPLNVFYSPQLRKTFAAVPVSAIMTETNDAPTVIKVKLPPSGIQGTSQSGSNLKSCLKYGSRANSCDIEAMLNEGKSSGPMVISPQPERNRDSSPPSSKRRCSETDAPHSRTEQTHPIRSQTPGSVHTSDTFHSRDLTRDRYSEHDLAFMLQQQQNQTKKSVSFSENIAKHLISPCNPAIKFDTVPDSQMDDDEPPNNMQDQDLTYALHGNRETSTRKPTARYGEMRRCQTDIIVVDRVHHLHSFTDSPPNEFRLQETDSLSADPEDEDDQAILEKTHVNIVPEQDKPEQIEPPQPVPMNIDPAPQTMDTTTNMTIFNDKENKIPHESQTMNMSIVTVLQIDDPSLEGLYEKVIDTVRRIFEIKRSEKTFFLNNAQNPQLDSVLKDELCVHIQRMLEHGRKTQGKDFSSTKSTNLWDLIEISINQGSSLQAFHEAKQMAQTASTYWPYKFQGFVFALLNKNELISWLYHFSKQKDVLLRHYNTPNALILTKTESTFNLFDRIMAQLEKLTALAFRLVYHAPKTVPNTIEDQPVTSNTNGNKSASRDWMRTISKRTTKTVTQPIPQPLTTSPPPTSAQATAGTDTLRSTFTRKINSLFTKTPTATAQRKSSSAVTAKLPSSKPTGSAEITSPTGSRRPRLSNVFGNTSTGTPTTASTNPAGKPVIVPSPKTSQGPRSSSIRRAISPSVVVAPSPPPAMNTTTTTNPTFHSKIPRPSLNVDKPKSARYRSTALPPK